MNQPVGGFGNNMDIFSAMAPWGASVQTAPNTGGLESLSYLEQKQAASLDAQNEMFGQQGAAYDRMGMPQSKWATGAQTFGQVAQGVGSLASIYMGLKNMKQQKEAFNFNKGVTNTNMNNSIMDYNRRLGETLSNRALNNGQGQGWVSDQLSKYSAKRSG